MTTTTSNNSATQQPTADEVQQKLDFNEYQLTCAADGTKAKTFHQWKNQGNIFTPSQAAAAAGTTLVAVVKTGTVSKSVIAKQVFAKHVATGTLVRKNIIVDFCSIAALTPAGAATYYANISALYKKDPAAFMTANYVAPIVAEEKELTIDQISLAAENELDAELATDTIDDSDEDTSADDAFNTSDFEETEEAA
jgi:hypothetical protein